MSDSHETLRQRVDELESTVRGLTQELVEANERIRQLEGELEARPETIVAGDDAEDDATEESAKPLGTAMETEPETGAEPDQTTESDTPVEDTGKSESEDSDDIIVA
jgi:predicted  nucleic acid-binding Zn-ribbon protein